MSTSSHAVFDVVIGNVYFVIVISNIYGQKIRFSESSENFVSEKSIFGQFEVISSTYKLEPPRRGGYFLLVHSKGSFWTKKTSSLSGLKKKLFNFPQKYRFWPFLATWVHLFSTCGKYFKKSLENLLQEVVRNIVLSFEPSICSGLRGGSRFASRHFPKSVILASCNFVGRPFVACYACSFDIFHSLQYHAFNCQ